MPEKMEINFILSTTPIRPVPTSFPPLGSTSLIDTLMEEGYSPKFYDIDALRPNFDQVLEYFKKEQPDILGISAVVSTAYRYVKELSHAVKKVSPKTSIILGGNLAASAEVVLRKCPISLCVIGEGERPLLNLMRHFEKYRNFEPNEDLKNIKGLAFLDENQDMRMTGFEAPVEKARLRQPNYEFLEKYSDINRFITDAMDVPHFSRDPRAYAPHRLGQKTATIMTSKGCVARCTFCHRWDKGYRAIPSRNLVEQIKYMQERWNVGFFQIADENFGSDMRQVDEFLTAIKPLDILFHVAGVRVHTIDRNPEIITRLKEAGCTAMYFGIESGSPKMLKVMEKGATLEQNRRVLNEVVKREMYTIIQLVLGMPGENEDTIRETIDFVNEITEKITDDPAHERISPNLFQALPGTPGYEYVRNLGLIGKSIDEEEAYLLLISDNDACSHEHYRNVAESSLAHARLWQHKIMREASLNFYRKRNWKGLKDRKHIKEGRVKDYKRGGYFRIIKTGLMKFVFLWRIEYIFHTPLESFRLLKSRYKVYGFRGILIHLGIVPDEDRSMYVLGESKSLRKVVTFPPLEALTISEQNMIPLRAGR